MDEHLQPCLKCSVGTLWTVHGEGERCPKELPGAAQVVKPLLMSEFWAAERAKRAGEAEVER